MVRLDFANRRHSLRAFLLAALSVGAVGCTLVINGRLDENAGVDCSEEEDGVSCGTRTVCIGGECVGSQCGDAVVDVASGEECEDGNEDPADGCEPGTCIFTCGGDEDCVDPTQPCLGGATCNQDTHLCEPAGLPPDDTVACEVDGGETGVCRKGVCAPPGFGDGMIDVGEECDDDTAGCAGNCLWVCEGDGECDDGSFCTGTETCNTGAHTCVAGTPLDCDDADPCSADTCAPATGCEHAQVDGDGDHFAPDDCAVGSEFQGGDCNDADIMQNPDAPEVCQNGEDDDCDGTTDELESPITWYPDADNDGYPAQTGAVQDCQDPNVTDPAGTINYIQPPLSTGGTPEFDCADNVADAHPNAGYQVGSFCVDGAGGSHYFCNCTGIYCFCGCFDPYYATYDWNCDGNNNDRRWPNLYASCCGTNGWTDGSVPGCGAAAEPLRTRNCGFACCLATLPLGAEGGSLEKASCTTTTADTAQQCR